MSNYSMRDALEQIKDLVSSPKNSWRWITNEGSVIWRGVIEDLCSAALAAPAQGELKECAAYDSGCVYGPYGRGGERQCKYCGDAAPAQSNSKFDQPLTRAHIVKLRELWLEENDPNDGTDVITPYDELLYTAQSEAKPAAWLSSFIPRHPDPHWRRIYTAHTSEKRARDYVSDLIDPKVEPLYTAPSAAPAQPVAWTARWHGSNPERGWSIYAGRDCIAYIGGDEGMSEAISEIVAAHNKCFDCDGGPCVMNCSGRESRISDATKGGEANPEAPRAVPTQSEAKPVEFKYPDFTEWWYTQDVIDEDEPSARGLARRIFNDARAIDPRPSAPATHTHRFAIDPSSDEPRCAVCGCEPESVPAGDGGDAESVTMDMLSTAEMNEYFRLLGAYLEVALGNAAGDRHDSTLPTHDALRDYVATVFARRKVRHAHAEADALEGWQFKKSDDEQYWVVLTPDGGFALARDAYYEHSSSRMLAQLAAILAKRGGA